MVSITGNKFDPNKDIPDLDGKIYIVTGGSAGIGFGIVAHLLQHNAARIYLLSNKEEHQEEAQEALKKYGDVSKVEAVKCNLADLAEVDKVAKDLRDRLEQLDALICNAGIGVGKFEQTKDGLDSHMQINHLSQMHLTLVLLPILKKTANSRIAFQSSELHRMAPSSLTFSDPSDLTADIGPGELYNRTKLAQVCFARALDRRLQPGGSLSDSSSGTFSGPWTNATHPGVIHTDQQRQAQEAYGEKYGKVADKGIELIKKTFGDPEEEGCRSALWAATSQEVVDRQVHGSYIVPDKKVTSASRQALDNKLGESLWELSEKTLKEKIGNLGWPTQFA